MERFGGGGKKRSVGVEIEAKPMKGWGGKKKKKPEAAWQRGCLRRFAPTPPAPCVLLARAELGRETPSPRQAQGEKKEKAERGRGKRANGGSAVGRRRGGQGEKRERKRERERGKKRIREGGSEAQGGKTRARPSPALRRSSACRRFRAKTVCPAARHPR